MVNGGGMERGIRKRRAVGCPEEGPPFKVHRDWNAGRHEGWAESLVTECRAATGGGVATRNHRKARKV